MRKKQFIYILLALMAGNCVVEGVAAGDAGGDGGVGGGNRNAEARGGMVRRLRSQVQLKRMPSLREADESSEQEEGALRERPASAGEKRKREQEPVEEERPRVASKIKSDRAEAGGSSAGTASDSAASEPRKPDAPKPGEVGDPTPPAEGEVFLPAGGADADRPTPPAEGGAFPADAGQQRPVRSRSVARLRNAVTQAVVGADNGQPAPVIGGWVDGNTFNGDAPAAEVAEGGDAVAGAQFTRRTTSIPGGRLPPLGNSASAAALGASDPRLRRINAVVDVARRAAESPSRASRGSSSPTNSSGLFSDGGTVSGNLSDMSGVKGITAVQSSLTQSGSSSDSSRAESPSTASDASPTASEEQKTATEKVLDCWLDCKLGIVTITEENINKMNKMIKEKVLSKEELALFQNNELLGNFFVLLEIMDKLKNDPDKYTELVNFGQFRQYFETMKNQFVTVFIIIQETLIADWEQKKQIMVAKLNAYKISTRSISSWNTNIDLVKDFLKKFNISDLSSTTAVNSSALGKEQIKEKIKEEFTRISQIIFDLNTLLQT